LFKNDNACNLITTIGYISRRSHRSSAVQYGKGLADNSAAGLQQEEGVQTRRALDVKANAITVNLQTLSPMGWDSAWHYMETFSSSRRGDDAAR
jgi:hypothetical protein